MPTPNIEDWGRSVGFVFYGTTALPIPEALDRLVDDGVEVGHHASAPFRSRMRCATSSTGTISSSWPSRPYELHDGDYDYFIPGSMTETAEAIRTKYNERIDSDPETDFGIRITSGYRNPKNNDGLRDSSTTSKHQWGRALDLAPVYSNVPPGKTYDQALQEIKEAADAAYPNPNTHYIYSTSKHVHISEI